MFAIILSFMDFIAQGFVLQIQFIYAICSIQALDLFAGGQGVNC